MRSFYIKSLYILRAFLIIRWFGLSQYQAKTTASSYKLYHGFLSKRNNIFETSLSWMCNQNCISIVVLFNIFLGGCKIIVLINNLLLIMRAWFVAGCFSSLDLVESVQWDEIFTAGAYLFSSCINDNRLKIEWEYLCGFGTKTFDAIRNSQKLESGMHCHCQQFSGLTVPKLKMCRTIIYRSIYYI